MPDPHVSVRGIVSGPGPPDPELGYTLDLLDFSADIEPGPGESFPRSRSMLVRQVILDDCVLNPGRYLPEFGVIPDEPGSANDCGTGSWESSPRCAGVLSERDAWNTIENEHEGPPCQYESRLRLRDCDDNTQTGDEVHWPGLDVWNIFGNSGQDLGKSFGRTRLESWCSPRGMIQWTRDPGGYPRRSE